MSCKSCVVDVLNFLLYTVGIVVGISIFVTYLFFYEEYNAAFWGICSAIVAACCLHLYVLNFRKKIEDWYTCSQLDHIKEFGIFFACSSFVVLGVYFSLVIVRKQSFSLGNSSFYPALVSSGLNLIWSLCLFLACQCYQIRLRSRNPLLLNNA